MAVLVKSAGAWRAASPHVRVGGAWVRPLHVHVKQHAEWKPLWTYSWQSGSWSACSTSCGGGTQTRDVTCRRSDGVDLPDAYCAGITKPATATACNTQSCYAYAWQAGDWSNCSNACGSGTQTRSTGCYRSDGAQVSASYCSGAAPAGSIACNAACEWRYGAWPSPTNKCGSETISRAVTCWSTVSGAWAQTTPGVCSAAHGSAVEPNKQVTTCTGCTFDEAAAVYSKVKPLNATAEQGRTNWTYAEVRTLLIQASGSVQAWWNQLGPADKVCPWPNLSKQCCLNAGYTYYPGT